MASLNPKPDIVLTDRGQQSDNIIRFGRHLLFAHDFAGIVDDAPPSPSPKHQDPQKPSSYRCFLAPGARQPRFAHHKWKGCVPNIRQRSRRDTPSLESARARSGLPARGWPTAAVDPTTPPGPSSVSPDSQTSTSAGIRQRHAHGGRATPLGQRGKADIRQPRRSRCLGEPGRMRSRGIAAHPPGMRASFAVVVFSVAVVRRGLGSSLQNHVERRLRRFAYMGEPALGDCRRESSEPRLGPERRPNWLVEGGRDADHC